MTTTAEHLELYRWMLSARRIDELERELVSRGEAFFSVSGAGHEAGAVLGLHLRQGDYLHCHYRDKALLLARGVPVEEFFDSLLCNGRSHSGGRQMSAHISAAHLNVMSIVGPVGNSALQAVGVALEVRERASQPIVLCCLGDGTTQQGEVMEAVAEAWRSSAPVLFLVEDNELAISTRTGGKTFMSLAEGEASSFHGVPIERIDGSDAIVCEARLGAAVAKVRDTRQPVVCVLSVPRLDRHTNADDDTVYLSDEERQLAKARDPLPRLRAALLASGCLEEVLSSLEDEVNACVRSARDRCLAATAPAAGDGRPPKGPSAAPGEYRGHEGGERLTMASALRDALRHRLAHDPRVSLFGQDIEDPKGDVFRVTSGLSTAFPQRVRNAPLSESTIVGTSIGRALAGGRPVAFIQFADFLPLAFNQLASELATMAWRTRDTWRAPVIVMASCGGYRPGLGPFHAQTNEAALAHLPGMNTAMPSTAADAAGILNAAFQSGQPTVILYPKALLNDRDVTTSADVERHFVPVGRSRVVQAGRDITIVCWGNTVPIGLQVAAALSSAGMSAEVIDLRWLSPWDVSAVCDSARRTGRLLVVHEDNRSVGLGAEIVATVVEQCGASVQCRRVTRPDTHVPCNYSLQMQVLPSFERVLEQAAEMLELDLSWGENASGAGSRTAVVPLLGSSPADQAVELAALFVKEGDRVEVGQPLAVVEADKAAADLASPLSGVVQRVHLGIGERAEVGTPLLTVLLDSLPASRSQQGRARQPHLSRRPAAEIPGPASDANNGVVIASLAAVGGRDRLDNLTLSRALPAFASGARSGDPIFDRTGIRTRVVADSSQDAVGMAAEAASRALREAGVNASDVSLVVCSTSTPVQIAPSMACQVLHRLSPHARGAAFDLSAACSGYLYALATAWDYLQQHPQAKVLVLTAEVMRGVVDINDPATSPIFADAATATLLSRGAQGAALARLQRPVLGSEVDAHGALSVPLPAPGQHVRMDGQRVFGVAVRRMSEALEAACRQAGLPLSSLDLVVPHQANGRIIEAMRDRLHFGPDRVWNGIEEVGNTSSSSIPFALDTVLHQQRRRGQTVGLCAFGAGFTYASALLEIERSAADAGEALEAGEAA